MSRQKISLFLSELKWSTQNLFITARCKAPYFYGFVFYCLIGSLTSTFIDFHTNFQWKIRRVSACLSYPKQQKLCHFVNTRMKCVARVCVDRTGTIRGSKCLFFSHWTEIEVEEFKTYSPRKVSRATFSCLDPQMLSTFTGTFHKLFIFLCDILTS